MRDQFFAFGFLPVEQVAKPIKAASYDSARTNTQNEKHWAIGKQYADPSPMQREILRNRCRYEVANNALLYGMVETYARDTVGSGPKVQFKPFGTQRDELALAFQRFLDEMAFVALLKTATKTYLIDGEVFLIATTEAPFYRIVETERIKDPVAATSPYYNQRLNQAGIPVEFAEDAVIEGIQYRNGVPVAYCVDGLDWFEADVVTHWYRQDFANQRRGVPRPAPSLETFAQLRRVDRSVTSAYETVAKVALVLEAKMLAPSQAANAFEIVDLVEGSALTLPDGYSLGQVKAEHPTTSHREFATYLIGSAARCFPMPLNKAIGTSQDSNFASGSLDLIDYERAIREDQSCLARKVVDRIVRMFLESMGYAAQPLECFFDELPHLNPERYLQAVKTKLELRLTSRTREAARLGADWVDIDEELAREEQTIKSRGALMTEETSNESANEPAADVSDDSSQRPNDSSE
jgi:hypothetical protein